MDKANHMKDVKPQRILTISELHKLLGLPKPLHPLVSFINNCDVKKIDNKFPGSLMLSFYKISFIEDVQGKIKYGQTYYDFEEGGMIFIAPGQILSAPDESEQYNGFNLFVHPDLLLGYPLATKINKYHFFSYATQEALHLSDKEKATITSIFKIINDELHTAIDDFSQDVIISQLELLLNYSQRFYKRQFITRKIVHHNLLQQFELLLADYFEEGTGLNKGLPTVQYFADKMNISAHYLSDMLKALTGLNAQQHVHEKLINRAKSLIASTSLTISEIAYQIGFEHPQSFHKLFKTKTGQSPKDYKNSFN